MFLLLDNRDVDARSFIFLQSFPMKHSRCRP
jgi:hypothetical protein